MSENLTLWITYPQASVKLADSVKSADMDRVQIGFGPGTRVLKKCAPQDIWRNVYCRKIFLLQLGQAGGNLSDDDPQKTPPFTI